MRITTIVAALTCAAATLLPSAPPAVAAPTVTSAPLSGSSTGAAFSLTTSSASVVHAYNRRDVWLAFPTRAGAEACKARDIKLASGWYMWRQAGFGHQNIVQWTSDGDRQIYLAAGWYHWKDCVRAASAGGYTYYHETYLRQRSTGGYAHLGRPRFWSPSRGTYLVRFGSELWPV